MRYYCELNCKLNYCTISAPFNIMEIKKHWKYLKDCYTKEKSKRNQYVPSGSAGKPKNSKTDGFRFYEQMRFLDDCLEHRP